MEDSSCFSFYTSKTTEITSSRRILYHRFRSFIMPCSAQCGTPIRCCTQNASWLQLMGVKARKGGLAAQTLLERERSTSALLLAVFIRLKFCLAGGPSRRGRFQARVPGTAAHLKTPLKSSTAPTPATADDGHCGRRPRRSRSPGRRRSGIITQPVTRLVLGLDA
jgi:hypothetical protein